MVVINIRYGYILTIILVAVLMFFVDCFSLIESPILLKIAWVGYLAIVGICSYKLVVHWNDHK